MKKILLIIFVLILLSSFASADLNSGLYSVFTFENTPASNLPDQVGTNSSSGNGVTSRVGGKNNFGWNFDNAGNDYVTLNKSILDTRDSFTISMWVNFTSLRTEAHDDYLYSITGIGGHANAIRIIAGPNAQALNTIGVGQTTVTFSNESGVGTWANFVTVYNGTHVAFYMNNSRKAIEAKTGSVLGDDNTFVLGNLFAIGSGDLDAVMDEVYFWNRALTIAEIDELWNNGDGTFYPFGAPTPGAPATPIIVAPSPVDNSNNNTNVTLNVTHSTSNNDVRYWLYFGDTSTLTETHLYIINETRTGDEYKSFLTNVSDGTFYWKWKVQNISGAGLFSLNTTQRTLIINTVSPTITIVNGNNFSISNTSIFNNYLTNFTINISFFDTHLAGGQILINITNSTGNTVFSILNVSITGTTVNYSRIVNISPLSLGDYTIKLIATDSHTLSNINDYDIVTGLSYFRYTTEEGNVIKITSNTMPLTKKTSKLKDRYDFEFNYLFQTDTYTFTIESYNKITYVQNSDYKAHFVIMGSNGNGNWIDFENPNLQKKDYKITKIDDYTYEVEVTANGIKKFKFSSIGGLNRAEEHYKFQIGAVLDIWVGDEETGNPINATATIGSQSAHTISSVSAARLVNITKDITSVTLNSTGYGIEAKSISVIQTFHNLSFNMSPVLATKLYFYDENSEALITEETFSVYLETTGFSNTFTGITDNPHTITGLTSGLYKLKASSSNYPERQYRDLNVSNTTTTNLNIYLINSTLGSEITFNVVDSNSDDIEDVNIDFYRTINGTTTLIAQEQTDFAGKARLYLDTNYEYSINFTKANYKQKIINLEPSVADSPYTIFLDDATVVIPPLAVSYDIRKLFRDGIEFNLTYTNLTQVVHFAWYDVTNYVDNMCLRVYASNETFYSNCSTSTSDFMNYTITTDNKTYEARAYAVKSGREYTLKILGINLLQVIVRLGKDTLILSWIAFITLGFLGLAKPFVSMTLGTISLIGMYIMGMLPISFSTIMGIIFVVVTIGVGIKRSRA